MNRMFKLATLGILVALLAAIVMPIAAQDDIVEPSAPGEGGVIIEGGLNSDPSTFNPIISNDTASSNVWTLMYPGLIGVDPQSGNLEQGANGSIAASWEYDETGTILTINIREDIFWSDGTQITANDWVWAANAVQSGTTSSPRTSVFYQTDDGTITDGFVHEVTLVDDFTIQLEIGNVVRDDAGEIVLAEDGTPELQAACDALLAIDAFGVIPSHAFEAQFGEDYSSMDADPYFYPGATFGPFSDPFLDFGVQVSLLADQTFADTEALDYVAAGEWIVEIYSDTTVGYERFLAGDFSTFGIPSENQNAFRDLADETGDFQYVEAGQNGYQWVGLNIGDPVNPVAGLDENGEPQDQGIHPIFGDLNVRLAFAHGIDVFEMIGTRPDGENNATGILEGNGYPIATHDHPVFSSTRDIYAELGVEPREYDPELAQSLLEEAGWVDNDGDGVRECTGCLYATEVDPSFEGSPLTFVLSTNAGNSARESIGETVKAQLDQIGFNVDFQAIEFGTLVDILTSQTFDAIILGWNLGSPPYAPGEDMRQLFGAGADVPGSGFNFTSFANEEFNGLVSELASLPGCDPEARAEGYARTQQILWEEAPYVWLYSGNVMGAAQANLANWDPVPPAFYEWNIDDWVVLQD